MQTQSSQDDVTSASKLGARLSANRNATRDFDEWCFRQLPALPLPSRVLDLGCGNGKQVKLFAPMLSPKSEIMGLDLSGEMLAQLKADYRAAARLTLLEGSFDELATFPDLTDESLDLAYAAYALYYTQDLATVVAEVHRLLKPGGVFWVIAPYFGTNREFLDIIRPLHEVEPFMDYVFDQFHQDVIALGEKQGFGQLKPSLLRNQIRFPDGASFMQYLRNSLFYRPGHDAAIEAAVQAVVEAQGYFGVSKNIISLQLRK